MALRVLSTVALKLEWDGVDDDDDADAPAAEEVSGVAQHPVLAHDVAQERESVRGFQGEEREHDREEEVQGDAHVPASCLQETVQFVLGGHSGSGL